MNAISPYLVAVDLDGAGWHPAAWRESRSSGRDLADPAFWVRTVGALDESGIDLVTLSDGFGGPPGSDGRTDRAVIRLDAIVLASRLAPTTGQVAILPTVVATHTEPFHTSKAIATLDYVSTGRAGLVVRTSLGGEEAAVVGRRSIDDPADPALVDELTEYVTVVRALWDSWEDDAEIRDVATGRFIDRDKLHYIDFHGENFAVRGPSITPRPPQGQPLVAVLAHSQAAWTAAGQVGDIVFVADAADVSSARAAIDAAHRAADRPVDEPVRLIVDLAVAVGGDAEQRIARLDGWADTATRPAAQVVIGDAAAVAEQMARLREAGADGVRLLPASTSVDAPAIATSVVPEMIRRQLFTPVAGSAWSATARGRLGWARPQNVFARAGATR
ncbi:LLM class flavin-dependent oxidoreductase [Williamsia sp. CHRR-6]|uniref:LLM class flavin-dependent oxidoreductase n=1 Tax=Williamsia sp. CHRR-6 TaxID=2835871 RepID=UPI0027DDE399|nr:LLM class flavin-dependent oxidoreductase [Williamsia sp. CHRR-6]